MDAALAGGLVSAAVTLLALVIHKARCIARRKAERDSSDSDSTPRWSCAVGTRALRHGVRLGSPYVIEAQLPVATLLHNNSANDKPAVTCQ